MKNISHIIVFVSLILYALVVAPASAAGLFSGKMNVLLFGSGERHDLAVQYSGNTFFTAAELNKVVEEELGNLPGTEYRKSAIDDAAFLIESHYRQEGFIRAMVDYQYDQTVAPPRVVFSIVEGKRVLVRSLSFAGNSHFSADRLLAANQEVSASLNKGEPFPLVEEQLSGLASEIRNLYLSEGFIDSRLSGPELHYSPDGTMVDVVFRVEEGAQYSIGVIDFVGQWGSELDTELQKLRKGLEKQTYYQRRRLLLKSRVTEIFEEFGYPLVQVEVKAVKQTATDTVGLIVSVAPGDRISVGAILVEGNERTRKSFIESRLRLTTGKLFRLSERRQSFQNLYQTGLFSSVAIELAGAGQGEEDSKKRDVVVRVEERKARELYVEPGWGSYEMFRLAAGYKDRNIFGSGRIFRVDSAFSFKGRTLECGYTDPWFFNSRINADFPIHYLYREEPVFTQEETGIGALFTRNFKKKISLTAGYRLSRNTISDVASDVDRQQIDTSYSSGIFSLQLVRDSRNDLFFPTGGYRGYVSGEIAAPPLGSDVYFYRLATGVRYFYALPGEIVLGMRYATGVVLPLGSQIGIPLSERYFNGGENSVRSFKESRLGPLDRTGDAIGGTAYNIISVEMRKKLAGNFAGSVFVDVGNIAPNRSLADGSSPLAADRATLSHSTFNDYFRDMRAGVGVGLQYLLPVGPARLDFAVNPSPNRSRGEDSYNLHFSIGMAF